MEKIVSQLDAEGYFVAAVAADESPLEPGVFLIPGGAVDVPAPTKIRAGKRYRLSGQVWVEVDMPALNPEPSQEPPTEAQRIAAAAGQRDGLLSYAALRIGPLQDAVDSNQATKDETIELALWRQYRIDVSRVDVKAISPTWPAPPA